MVRVDKGVIVPWLSEVRIGREFLLFDPRRSDIWGEKGVVVV